MREQYEALCEYILLPLLFANALQYNCDEADQRGYFCIQGLVNWLPRVSLQRLNSKPRVSPITIWAGFCSTGDIYSRKSTFLATKWQLERPADPRVNGKLAWEQSDAFSHSLRCDELLSQLLPPESMCVHNPNPIDRPPHPSPCFSAKDAS